MAGKDPRRLDADIYICDAIQELHAAQSKHFDHTDVTTVRAALDGLGAVQRSTVGQLSPMIRGSRLDCARSLAQ